MFYQSVFSTAAYAQEDSIQYSHACTTTDPAPNEVFIYTDTYAGTCRGLYAGFYPYPANLGVPNDSITSVKVGSGVRAHYFLDIVYGTRGWPTVYFARSRV